MLFNLLDEMGSEGMEGEMVYQDEDGNLIMYNQEDMMDGEEEDRMGDESYGMEGSPEVRKALTYLIGLRSQL